MTTSQLSASSQNYLKAVWTLGEWSNQPVTASTIAAKTGVKLSTASDAIRKLTDQGYLAHAPYGAVALTQEGLAVALAMVRRHRLIEAFLVEVLGYRTDQVHDEAEVLEHAVSDFMIERIDARLGHPSRDPHGDPIPDENGVLPACSSHSLADVASHAAPVESVRVERISDDDPELLRFLADRGIVYGVHLTILEPEPYSDGVRVSIGEHEPINLGRIAAAAVWVSQTR